MSDQIRATCPDWAAVNSWIWRRIFKGALRNLKRVGNGSRNGSASHHRTTCEGTSLTIGRLISVAPVALDKTGAPSRVPGILVFRIYKCLMRSACTSTQLNSNSQGSRTLVSLEHHGCGELFESKEAKARSALKSRTRRSSDSCRSRMAAWKWPP
jgi:hypothetical protein